jgi:hypothetical protein
MMLWCTFCSPPIVFFAALQHPGGGVNNAELTALWEDACRGDPSAREKVCLALGAEGLRALHGWRLGPNDPAPEDVLDEIIAVLRGKLEKGERPQDPLGYVTGVARCVLAERRERARSYRAALWERACQDVPAARNAVRSSLAADLLREMNTWRLGPKDPGIDGVLDDTMAVLLEKLGKRERLDDPLAYAVRVARNVLADLRKEDRDHRGDTVPLSECPEPALEDERLRLLEIEERVAYLRGRLTPDESDLLYRMLSDILAGRGGVRKRRVALTHALACKMSRVRSKIFRLLDDFENRECR